MGMLQEVWSAIKASTRKPREIVYAVDPKTGKEIKFTPRPRRARRTK